MPDERWLAVADWGSELVWHLVDQLRWWLFWDIRLVLVILLTGVAIVIWNYATGQFFARPPEED